MKLKAIKFCRFKGQEHEWAMEGKPVDSQSDQWVTFEDINLIVGKNASGKTKTITVIRQLADLVVGNVTLSNLLHSTASYNVQFEDNKNKIDYILEFIDGKIVQELFILNGIEKLNRAAGQLYYDKVEGFLEFQIEDNRLAISRFDKVQQPFFESLYSWGKNLSHYRFGGQLGKDTLIRDVNSVKADEEVDLKDIDGVVEVFIKAKITFGESYVLKVIEDMEKLSYYLGSIDVMALNFLKIPGYGLGVKENDIDSVIDQTEISQGMFRALSLLIQLNYSLMSKIPSCILIDDIGEGLDYERSKCLIDLIIEKIKGSPVQVLMTTNDRFVMNNIPLEYWSIIHRVPKKSLFYNYRNSKKTFEDYSYTGLNNFDFLSTEFYKEGFGKKD